MVFSVPLPIALAVPHLQQSMNGECLATCTTLYRLLTFGWPSLVAVDTGELPYWQSSVGHVVVLVGMDGEHVFLNDPALPEAPMRISMSDFYLAWYEQKLSYAVISAQ